MSTHSLDRLPPQNIEAEQSVLGAILIDHENALPKVIELIHPHDFYRGAHRAIFDAMLRLFDEGLPVDLVTLTDKLRAMGRLEEAGGQSYIFSLAAQMPTAANVTYHSDIVRDYSHLRKLISAGSDIVSLAYEDGADPQEVLGKAEDALFTIASGSNSKGFTPIRNAVKDAFEKMERLYDKKADITGLATGLQDLDEITAGLQNSDLIVVGARPSMGKTALGMNIAEYVAIELGLSVAIFSIEMSQVALAERMICARARVDSNRVRKGQIAKDEWGPLTKAAGEISAAPLFVDDSSTLNITELRARARRLKAEHGIGLIVVDYLQLLGGRPIRYENRVQEVSDVSRSLKAIAKELDVPVVALSQLNRQLESRTDKRPNLSDLRESGAIEQDADVIAFLYRDAAYSGNKDDNSAEIIVAKQRNGPTGTVKAVYLRKFTRFENAANSFYAGNYDNDPEEVF